MGAPLTVADPRGRRWVIVVAGPGTLDDRGTDFPDALLALFGRAAVCGVVAYRLDHRNHWLGPVVVRRTKNGTEAQAISDAIVSAIELGSWGEYTRMVEENTARGIDLPD